MLEAGTKVKDFILKDDKGNDFKFSDHLGERMVIYFYPKDDTPGCTKQACEFRNKIEGFKERDVTVIGISMDSTESHRKFIDKYNLPFTLLSDPEHKVLDYFGAWEEKNMYGVKKMGVIRSTFIINKDGVIEKVYKRAIPDKNAEQILKYLDENK